MHGPWRTNMNLSCLFCIFFLSHLCALCGPFSRSELTRVDAVIRYTTADTREKMGQSMWRVVWANSKIPHMKKSLLICSCALNIQYKIDGSLSSIMQSGLWAISHYTSVFSWPTSAFAVIIPSRANYRECVYNSSVS